VLDAAGNSVAYSGARTRPEMSEAPAQDVCAIGNILANARVPAAMLRTFQADPMAPLAERLLRTLDPDKPLDPLSRNSPLAIVAASS
jgi:uncharacterized Ntn-hydrolase superfamily protein